MTQTTATPRRAVATTPLPPPDGPAAWTCPVCGAPVVHPHRPGRARVYCTNACRQRAYRWRCRRRHVLVVPEPAERARTRDKTHALRSDHDFITGYTHRVAGRPNRRVTACGAFANAARDRHRAWTHTKFFARIHPLDPTRVDVGVCSTCARLQRSPLRSVADVLTIIEPMQQRARKERSTAA